MTLNPYDANATSPKQGGNVVEELAYRLRQQQLMAEFDFFSLKTNAAQELLQEATRLCAHGMHTQMCKVMAYQADQDDLLLVAGVGWKPAYVGHARAGADLDSPAGFAYRTGRPVISNHLQGESRFRTPKILIEHGIKRAINVMLLVAGKSYGVLEVDSPGEGRFTEADLAFMQGFANLLGVALNRQQFEADLRIKNDCRKRWSTKMC
jgi:GAF domain-containing protein